MRILFVSRNFFPDGVVGGAQLCIKFLTEGLLKYGHTVSVLSLDNYKHFGNHKTYGIAEYRTRLRNPYLPSGASLIRKAVWHLVDRGCSLMAKDYRAIVKEFKPDVVNTNVMAGVGTSIWQVAKDSDIPIVHTVYDYYLLCLKSSMRTDGANCSRPCRLCRAFAMGPARKKATYVSEVIYVSQHIRQAHQSAGVFSTKTGAVVIPEAYSPESLIVKRRGLITDGRLTLGFFGRISPEKGLKELICSLRAYPRTQWILNVGGVGEQSYVAKLKGIASGLPIHFVGMQAPSDFYPTIDALIVPSLWHDPAPRVAFEAGIHGAVPIVSNRGGLPELVAFGKRGLIFNPDKETTLHDALNFINNERLAVEQFRTEWDLARSVFAPDAVARETLNVYKRAMGILRPEVS